MQMYKVVEKGTGKIVSTKKPLNLFDATKLERRLNSAYPGKYELQEDNSNGTESEKSKGSFTEELF